MADKRLIDAEPIKKFIQDGLNNPDPQKALGHDAIEILAEIECTPTVDAVEVVHGRWKPRAYHKFNSEGRVIKYCDFYYCSECGTKRPMVPPYNYCPNCGAKMDGGAEDGG